MTRVFDDDINSPQHLRTRFVAEFDQFFKSVVAWIDFIQKTNGVLRRQAIESNGCDGQDTLRVVRDIGFPIVHDRVDLFEDEFLGDVL